MQWSEIITTSLATSVFIGLLGYIGKEWLSVRLKQSVTAEYKNALELYKKELDWQSQRKKQAAELADFFSIWLRSHYFPNENMNENRYELQKKYWQLVLWLDAPVLKAVHDALHADGPTLAHKQALIEVRKLYVDPSDSILPEELFHFDPVTEISL